VISAIDDSLHPIVIAGAGPHGLATTIDLVTVASRLRGRLVVVGPA
jgi:hypothetical protein